MADKHVMGKEKLRLFIILIIAVCLTACGKNAEEETKNQKVLVLANFDNSEYLREQVKQYNEMQQEYRIEIKQYERSEEVEEDGVLLLQREIAAGILEAAIPRVISWEDIQKIYFRIWKEMQRKIVLKIYYRHFCINRTCMLYHSGLP